MGKSPKDLYPILSLIEKIIGLIPQDTPSPNAAWLIKHPTIVADELRERLFPYPQGRSQCSVGIDLALTIIKSLPNDLSTERIQEITNNPQLLEKKLNEICNPPEKSSLCQAMTKTGNLIFRKKVDIPQIDHFEKDQFLGSIIKNNYAQRGVPMTVSDIGGVLKSTDLPPLPIPKTEIEFYSTRRGSYADQIYDWIPENDGDTDREKWILEPQLEYLLSKQPHGEWGPLSINRTNLFLIRLREHGTNFVHCYWDSFKGGHWHLEIIEGGYSPLYPEGTMIGIKPLEVITKIQEQI